MSHLGHEIVRGMTHDPRQDADLHYDPQRQPHAYRPERMARRDLARKSPDQGSMVLFVTYVRPRVHPIRQLASSRICMHDELEPLALPPKPRPAQRQPQLTIRRA